MNQIKQHWEQVFENKNANEVSWTQAYPSITMQFINQIQLPKHAKIIEVGGGESFLVDTLLEYGYMNITVLDISEKALQKAKQRLGIKADAITWIVSDILDFESIETYDFWHDRAVFHFLTQAKDIEIYKQHVSKYLIKNGYFLLGTFAKNGPLKCSGLEITQYDIEKMLSVFQSDFELIDQYTETHITPFNTEQNFQFAGFKKN